MLNRFLHSLRTRNPLFRVEAEQGTPDAVQPAHRATNSMPRRIPISGNRVAENDPRSPFAQIRRNLESCGALLPGDSQEFQAMSEVRRVVADWLEEISDELELLNQEIQEEEHQSRNIVQAGLNVLETARSESGTIEEFATKMRAWLLAQVSARASKSYDDAGLAMMKPLVEHLVDPGKYGVMADRRRLDGGPLVVPAATIRILKMLLRELSTNAAKHGAFRKNGGHVDIRWHVEGSGDAGVLLLNWQERCTSEIQLPEVRGEGYMRMTQRMPQLYGYEVEERHGNDGVHYLFRIRHETVARPDKPKVLVVDDEMDIFDMLERRYDKSDVSVAHAASPQEAIAVLQMGQQQDLVLIDKGLGDEDGRQVAEYLALRGVPFAFLTGEPDGEWGKYSRALRISKPLSGPELYALIPALLTSPEMRRLK